MKKNTPHSILYVPIEQESQVDDLSESAHQMLAQVKVHQKEAHLRANTGFNAAI